MAGQRDAEGVPVLLLSSGDFLRASPFSWLALRNTPLSCRSCRRWGTMPSPLETTRSTTDTTSWLGISRMRAIPRPANARPFWPRTPPPRDGHPLAADGMLPREGLLRLHGRLRVGVIGLIGEEAVALTHTTPDVTFRST